MIFSGSSSAGSSAGCAAQRPLHQGAKCVMLQPVDPGPCNDHHIGFGGQACIVSEGRSQAPPDAVAHDGLPDPPGDRHPEARPANRALVGEKIIVPRAVDGRSRADAVEVLSLQTGFFRWDFRRGHVAYRPGVQTAKRFLPFFRRRLKIFRPERVAILAKNPWVRARLILEGCHVLFTRPFLSGL